MTCVGCHSPYCKPYVVTDDVLGAGTLVVGMLGRAKTIHGYGKNLESFGVSREEVLRRDTVVGNRWRYAFRPDGKGIDVLVHTTPLLTTKKEEEGHILVNVFVTEKTGLISSVLVRRVEKGSKVE
jgi:hypothetical protein